MPFQRSFDPDEETVTKAIRDLNGNVAAICKQLGTTRGTFVRWLSFHPEVQQTLVDAREEMLDMAETSLYRKVLSGEAWAVCFFLKTQGRKRGYIERAETFNLKIDLNELSLEQLERIAAGEHPSLVLGAAAGQNPEGTGATDPLTIEGTSRLGAATEASE